MSTISEIIEKKQYRILYPLARYFYRIGEPILDDKTYDFLENNLKKFYPEDEVLKPYYQRTYDDDPIPIEELEYIGVKPVYTVPTEGRAELYSYLNEDKSFSIESAHDYEDAFKYFQMLKDLQLDFVASLKMDGVCTKMLYVDDQFKLSLSRGRNGDSFDYTDNSAKIMPQEFKTGNKIFPITGESYVLPEGLDYLRQKYNKPTGYVSGKSAAISMLRVTHDREDYRYVKTRVFSADGLADTLENTFNELVKNGFEVPPYLKFSWEEIPATFEDFKMWVDTKILIPIQTMSKGIPSDGVVIEVNDLNWIGEQNNQYINRQKALKIGYWGKKIYSSIVRDICIEQQRIYKSIRVKIDPVITSDGSTATVINCFTPDILISSKASVGSKIYFERNSNAVNVLIHGEKLRELERMDNE